MWPVGSTPVVGESMAAVAHTDNGATCPLPFVDAHFHLFRIADLPSQGLATNIADGHDVLWADYAAAVRAQPLRAAIAVEVDLGPGAADSEVAFIEGIAAANPQLRAFVAWAPIERPDLPQQLNRLKRHDIVHGVRRVTQNEADPMFCARPSFVAGVQAVAAAGYVCDVCVRHTQLEGVIALAGACPEAVIVVDHLGKPDIAGQTLDPWRAHMATLAEFPNVYCKFSVVVQGREDDRWTQELVAPFATHLLQEFGPDRLIFASNWPVMTAVTAYDVWYRDALALTATLRAEDRTKIFASNAARIYRIGDAVS